MPFPSSAACAEWILAATIPQMLLHALQNVLMRVLAALVVHRLQVCTSAW